MLQTQPGCAFVVCEAGGLPGQDPENVEFKYTSTSDVKLLQRDEYGTKDYLRGALKSQKHGDGDEAFICPANTHIPRGTTG